MCAGSRGIIKQAIKQGDPNGIAVAILGNLAGQRASLWPKKYMHWADATTHGTALAGESVIFVFYTPVLTHEAADKLCHIIWGMRSALLLSRSSSPHSSLAVIAMFKNSYSEWWWAQFVKG